MRSGLIYALPALAALAGGCGTQGALLGSEGSYLLTATDVLAVPGERVELRARLEGGDMLQPQAGHVVRFCRDGKLYRAAETDEDGVATVRFTPKGPGDIEFVADVSSAGMPDEPPRPQVLTVTCRSAAAPMLIVDLDKTIVASGFHTVLIGNPEPMPASADILKKLARTHTIVYLTHRPDYFGAKSKQWLWENDYPKGPLLLSSISGFLKGSGAYKTDVLRGLVKRFRNMKAGIGDKVSDAIAYHENGMRSFLIVRIPDTDKPEAFDRLADSLAPLPPAVQVVTGWNEVNKALFGKARFPAAKMVARLRKMAADRRAVDEGKT